MNSVSTFPATNSGWEARSIRKLTLVERPYSRHVHKHLSCVSSHLDVVLGQTSPELPEGRVPVLSPDHQLGDHGVIVHTDLATGNKISEKYRSGNGKNWLQERCTPVVQQKYTEIHRT